MMLSPATTRYTPSGPACQYNRPPIAGAAIDVRLIAAALSDMALDIKSLPTILGIMTWRTGIMNEKSPPWMIDAASMYCQMSVSVRSNTATAPARITWPACTNWIMMRPSTRIEMTGATTDPMSIAGPNPTPTTPVNMKFSSVIS